MVNYKSPYVGDCGKQTGYERALRDGCACDRKRANRAATGTAHLHHFNSGLSAAAVKGPGSGAQGVLSTNKEK